MMTVQSEFLRRQAELCIALSRATIDLTIAGRLRRMAADFRATALLWENELHGEPGRSDLDSAPGHASKN